MAVRKSESNEWDLEPGTVLRRQEVHDRYGGSRQPGIAPVANSVDVLVFTGAGGRQYGYDYDGWHDDGTFHYTGAGQVGHQTLNVRGNKALSTPGRRIRLFREAEKETYVEYVGEFQVGDGPASIYEAQSPDVHGNMRTVYVFELWPVDAAAAAAENVDLDSPVEQVVPVESSWVRKYARRQSSGPTLAERREGQLVGRYVEWLKQRNHETNGRRIRLPRRPSKNADLFDETLAELIEAKSDVSTETMRYALGQLFDYERYINHQRLAVLVPEKPKVDLVDLLTRHDITCIYEGELGVFHRIEVGGTADP